MNLFAIAATLDAAADIIEENGLAQGTFWEMPDAPGDDWKPGKACCITGAIGVVRGYDTATAITAWLYDHDPAMRGFAAHLGHPDNVFHVLRWNDDTLRTPAGVARSLREAAARIRTGELVVPS
jgi:hypothetical protein